MKKFVKTIKSLFQKRVETKESFNFDINMKTIIALILGLAAVVLSVFNVIKGLQTGEWEMLYTTIALAFSLFVSALIIKAFKKRELAGWIIGITISAVFSYYAISGQNDGFAILWIILVPAVSTMFLSFEFGLIIDIYFLLFLIALFYTPLRNYLPNGVYTETFKLRFPALYGASLVACTFITGQKIFFANKSEDNSLYDALTSLRNRRFYNDLITTLEKTNPVDLDLTIVSCDLNDLKEMNDTFGHDAGDQAIIAAGEAISEVFSPITQNIFRTGGDEFVIFFYDRDNQVDSLISKLFEASSKKVVKNTHLSMSAGYIKGRDSIEADIHQLISLAETNMYKYKEEYHKKINRPKEYLKSRITK